MSNSPDINTAVAAFRPEIIGEKVVISRWHRREVKRMVGTLIDEGILEPGSVPPTDKNGRSILSPQLAAYTAIAMAVNAENVADAQHRSITEQRALVLGTAALTAGELQRPPLAEQDPEIHFELLDMVAELQEAYKPQPPLS